MSSFWNGQDVESGTWRLFIRDTVEFAPPGASNADWSWRLDITLADDTDADDDGILDEDDNCPDVANADRPIRTGMGAAMPVTPPPPAAPPWGTIPPSQLDQDVFRFMGTQDETVTITLEARLSPPYRRTRHPLVAGRAISPVFFTRLDSSAVPDTIQATLPATGRYLLTVAEQPLWAPGSAFRGGYCVTLASSGAAAEPCSPPGGPSTTTRPVGPPPGATAGVCPGGRRRRADHTQGVRAAQDKCGVPQRCVDLYPGCAVLSARRAGPGSAGSPRSMPLSSLWSTSTPVSSLLGVAMG